MQCVRANGELELEEIAFKSMARLNNPDRLRGRGRKRRIVPKTEIDLEGPVKTEFLNHLTSIIVNSFPDRLELVVRGGDALHELGLQEDEANPSGQDQEPHRGPRGRGQGLEPALIVINFGRRREAAGFVTAFSSSFKHKRWFTAVTFP